MAEKRISIATEATHTWEVSVRPRAEHTMAPYGGAWPVGDTVPVLAQPEYAIQQLVAGWLAEESPFAARGTYRLVKRTLDVALAAAALVVLLPLFLVVALLIRLDSRGPVFYVQTRIGYHGRLFRIVKFRTMRESDRPIDPTCHKPVDDPRVTHVGRVLRRSSIDELPQLVNVLRGEMSLVGPRPEIAAIALARYEPWQYRRLLAPQGMTGWWQVTGRGTRLLCEHTEDDLYYIEHASLRFDLKILLLTLLAIIRREGAF